LAALCGLAAVQPARGAGEAPPDVQFTRDLVYGHGGEEELKLDLARPANPNAKRLPCVVFIHGGAWSAGQRGAHDEDIRRMAGLGYVAATVDYRLAPTHRFPAQVQDVKCAVRYLRAHAEQYGLDPDRIAAWGVSAGAHLALMLGVTQKSDGLEGDGGWPEQSSAVQAVVAFYPRTDLTAADFIPSVRLGH
jgi:acetyl esterase/lipase